MIKPSLTIPEELPLQYCLEQPDRTSPLMHQGEMLGLFVGPELRKRTEEFLARQRASGGLDLRPGGGL